MLQKTKFACRNETNYRLLSTHTPGAKKNRQSPRRPGQGRLPWLGALTCEPCAAATLSTVLPSASMWST